MLVHFDGWSSRHDEYVMLSSGRLRPLPPGVVTQVKKRQKVLVLWPSTSRTQLLEAVISRLVIKAFVISGVYHWRQGTSQVGRWPHVLWKSVASLPRYAPAGSSIDGAMHRGLISTEAICTDEWRLVWLIELRGKK